MQNILAWMPGSDPKGKAVLVVAHYDGVAAGPAAARRRRRLGGVARDGARAARAQDAARARRHRALHRRRRGRPARRRRVRARASVGEGRRRRRSTSRRAARPGARSCSRPGPGNLDAVARAPRARATSPPDRCSRRCIARSPNDTDLSELAVLGLPALNFAFADGVERYHTSHDDVAHLNPGSLQHHGAQMLGARARRSPTSRCRVRAPATPCSSICRFVGLVIYPASVRAAAGDRRAGARRRRGVSRATRHPRRRRHGARRSRGVRGVRARSSRRRAARDASRTCRGAAPPQWSGVYGAVVALLAIAIDARCFRVAKRWTDGPRARGGALVVWAILAVAVTAMAPGASYLFTWPVLFAAVARAGSGRVGVGRRDGSPRPSRCCCSPGSPTASPS